MYSSLPESPQDIGDLIGLAYRTTRQNLLMIFKFILGPSIFTVLAGIVFQWVFTYGAANIAQTKDIGSAVGLFGLSMVALVVLFSAWWVLGMRLLALVRVMLGFAPDLDAAMTYMKRRKWAVLGVYFLGSVLFFAVFIMLGLIVGLGVAASMNESMRIAAIAITGVLATVGIVAAIITYLIAAHLSFCVLACEDQPVPYVIGRTLHLVFNNFGRAVAFASLFAMVFTIISFPLSMPVAALTFSDALQHGLTAATDGAAGAYKPPLYILVLTQVWEALMGFLLRPLTLFAFALFYYDLRMRSEGLDLKRKLELVETKAA